MGSAAPMRVVHVTFLSFKQETSREEREAFFNGLRAMEQIPGVTAVEHGRALDEESDRYCIFIYLEDVTALTTYISNPLHLDFAARHWPGLVADYTTDDYLIYGPAPWFAAGTRPGTGPSDMAAD